jgi:methionyl-tRNA formyltransferase
VLDRRIRALHPDPTAYTVLRGERIKLHRAAPVAGQGEPGMILASGADGIVVACGEGALAIRQLQLPGGKALTAREVLNGRADWFAVGNRFDPPAGEVADGH